MKKFTPFLFLMATLFSVNLKSATAADIKASYVYNFVKFVDWPNPTDVFRLCVVGNDAVSVKLLDLNGRRVRGQNIKVITKHGQARNCDLTFYAEGEEKFVSSYLVDELINPGLTISCIEGFASNGGVVELFKLGNVIKFNINLANAEKANLLFRAKVLELANEIYR